MSSVVRTSKFRHVYGTAYKKERCFDNLKISNHSSTEGSIIKLNPLFIAINWEASGGGAFTIIPHEKCGRFNINELPLFLGHSSQVIDLEFSPFNDHLIASCSDDGSIALWQIPENGPTENVETPLTRITGHSRKVTILLFHPTAQNLLASASADLSIKFWNVETGEEKLCISGAHSEAIYSMCFNYNGTLLATTSKDKKIRVFEVRSGTLLQEATCHHGIKSTQIVWLGNSSFIATTGFSKTSDRQIMIWNANDLSAPVKIENLDTSSGVLVPYFDADTSMLYIAGKGDGNIRFYEFLLNEQALYYLSEYKSNEPQRGTGFIQKRALNISANEIARAYKVLSNCVEPISFRVTRKSDRFQEDIFPDTIGPDAPITCKEFFAGKTSNPILISLREGFKPCTTSTSISLASSREFSMSSQDLLTIPQESMANSQELTPKRSSLSIDDLGKSTLSFDAKEAMSCKQECSDKDALIAELKRQNEELRQLITAHESKISEIAEKLTALKTD